MAMLNPLPAILVANQQWSMLFSGIDKPPAPRYAVTLCNDGRSIMATTLYETDIYAWSQQPVNLLRAEDFAEVDWHNSIEAPDEEKPCKKFKPKVSITLH